MKILQIMEVLSSLFTIQILLTITTTVKAVFGYFLFGEYK